MEETKVKYEKPGVASLNNASYADPCNATGSSATNMCTNGTGASGAAPIACMAGANNTACSEGSSPV